MKSNLAFCIALFAGMGPVLLAQGNAQRQSAVITLVLPGDIASETVQINFFMLGSFGGYGGYVDPEKGRMSYDLPASMDGKTAEAVKIIAYLPGCEIVKLEITMQGLSEARTLPCKTLGKVPLHGRMLPVPVVQSPGVEVEISYLADWDHEFFGIMDGMVTTIHVATAIPDAMGRFDVEVPDFFRQADLGKGSFRFILRNKTSLNIIATLRPENMPRFFDGLAIGSSYAPFVMFSADTSISTPLSDSGVVKDKPND